ncbi:hypothetical protein PLESTM_000188400 [Pleodorina starrii]|nr:hypothetical protein PLESTM_000188400 [Pleodorina starrii]
MPYLPQEAVSYLRSGDPLSAAAALTLLMRTCRTSRLTHRDLPTARSNLAAALLAAGGLAEEALAEAEAVVAELEARPPGLLDAPARRALVRGHLARGQALSALGRHAAAVASLERGLALEPSHTRMRSEMDAAGRALLRQLLAGCYSETLALPAPEPRPLALSYNVSGAVSPAAAAAGAQPDATALQLRWEELLPARLLTPRAAEVDDRTRDTYNFVTIETDVRMPKRCLRVLHDSARLAAVREAVQAAVEAARRGGGSGGGGEGDEDERDVRVLLLGSCAGLMGLVALRAGAVHVTCVERWLYLASAAGEVLAGAGVPPDRYRVSYRRPTELRLREDVPICCNVVVATDLLNDGLLTSGLLPAVRHVAAAGLLTRDAVVVPAAATVWMQAAQLAAPPPRETSGLDLQAMDRLRWWPSHSLGGPMAEGAYLPLSQPKVAWHFDVLDCPDSTEARTLDLELEVAGRFNAVVWWYDIRLYGDIRLVTHQPLAPRSAPQGAGDGMTSSNDEEEGDDEEEAHNESCWRGDGNAGRGDGGTALAADEPGQWAMVVVGGGGGERPAGRSSPDEPARLQSLRAAVHWLPGPIRVAAGDVLPLTVCHNTVAMRFEVLTADYQWLVTRDPSLPPAMWAGLADTARLAAYRRAIERAVRRLRAAGRPVVALDVGCGGGALALAAAAAGADSVVAAEVHPGLVAAARRCAAENGLGHKVAVIPGDVGELVRGRDLPYTGANLIILDLFDAGLLGHRALATLECVKRRLAGSGPPAAEPEEAAPHPPPPQQQQQQPDAEVEAAGRGGADAEEGGAPGGRVEVVPAAARVWAVGLELLTRRVAGEDMSALNKYRWDDKYETVRLQDLPYRQLTAPVPVFDFNFTQPPADDLGGGRGGAVYPSTALVEAQVVAKGVLNAVAFWYDLKLDEHSDEPPLSNAPPGLASTAEEALAAAAAAAAGGANRRYGRRYSRRCQALQYLDCALPVALPGGGGDSDTSGGGGGGRTVVLHAQRTTAGIRFGLRPGVGVPVPRPPFKVEWGGGVSIENPHVQRARYCQLLVSEWLQRLPRIGGGGGGATTSIAADLAPLWRHCGSLALDPVALAEVTHRLTLLERLYGKAGSGGGGAGIGADDGRAVAAAVAAAEGSVGVEEGGEGRVGLVRPEDVSLGLPAVWF